MEGGGIYRSAGRLLGTALGLIGLAWTFHVSVPAHAALHPENTGQFFNALGRALAWPHVGQPVAAVVLNLPLVWVVLARLGGRHRAAEGEDFILLLAGWGSGPVRRDGVDAGRRTRIRCRRALALC